jgi:myo-inositol-1(or 4)-monophosphatase
MTPYLATAIQAAHEAGKLLKQHFEGDLTVSEAHAHDIKLELDVRSQELITGILLARFPDHAIYGEEGLAGNQQSEFHWIVDPIDGTVNYFYGLPHFCISIALRQGDEIILGVIFDPMRDELWQVEKGERPTLNGRPISVSKRTQLSEAIVSIGFAKSVTTINAGLPLLEKMVRRVRKCRMQGSAALDMAYVASGRMDAYIESTASLWDVAAGKILVESAGGSVKMVLHPGAEDKYSIAASSGNMDLEI